LDGQAVLTCNLQFSNSRGQARWLQCVATLAPHHVVPPVVDRPAAAKTHYGTSLANVDWLHGSAESLLTITNLLIGEKWGQASENRLLLYCLLYSCSGGCY
jgi:hypothetical protein